MTAVASALSTAIDHARRTGCWTVEGVEIWTPGQLADVTREGEAFLEIALRAPATYALRDKPFLLSSRGQKLGKTHPLRTLLAPVSAAINEIAERPMQCFSAEFWAVRPGPWDFSHSQLWHRDHESVPLWKCFLNLHAVGPESGPLEYVAQSHRGDYDLCAQQSFARPDVAMPESRVMRACTPAGTAVFADTSGIHRGGRITEGHRLQAVWAFFPTESPLWGRTLKGGGR